MSDFIDDIADALSKDWSGQMLSWQHGILPAITKKEWRMIARAAARYTLNYYDEARLLSALTAEALREEEDDAP